MGGRKIKSSTEKIGNIQLQTSTYGLGIAIRYGTNRGSGNLIWYGNFKAIPHTEKTKAGKGLGAVTQENTTYTYTASVMMSLGEGPIVGIGTVWKGKDQSTLAALGLTLFAGNSGQAVWSFLSGYAVTGNWSYEVAYGYRILDPATGTYSSPSFVSQALGYDTTAYLAGSDYDLGEDATIANHGFEVYGMHIIAHNAGNEDAHPADIITDFLTDANHGSGFTTGMLGDYTQYRAYCTALGLFFSPQVEEQSAASSYLQDWLDATNTDPLWSDGLLKLLPRGDTAVTGNAVTYTPDLTPIYDLGADAFTNKDLPVRIVRKSPADAYNRLSLQFSNRASQYNDATATAEDQNAIEQYGLRNATTVSAPFITESSIAKMVVQLQLQRLLYVRNEFEFDITEAYALLEPGDKVTLTDPSSGLDHFLVRILHMEEDDTGYSCRAEEMLTGVAHAALYPHDDGLRYIQNLNAHPGQPAAPYIFELPADPTTTGLALGIAIGKASGDVLYGGCNVWMSLDGVNYVQMGTINGSSRYGTLRSSFSNVATTAHVQMLSEGQLADASSTEASNAVTLVSTGSEYFSYETATLVGTDQYDLTGLHRPQYDTMAATHSSGAKWARVDSAICRIENLDLSLIGQTVHFKFTAFNTFEGGELDLADAADYTYTLSGYMQTLGEKAKLARIGDDGWITPVEKLQAILDYDALTNEKPHIDAQADDVGISRTAFDTAYAALGTYLGGLTPAWNNTDFDTPVTRSAWDTAWGDVEDARRALVIAIRGVDGADGLSTATVFIFKRAASSPTLPSVTTTYTFATGVLTGLNNGWTQAVPAANGNPLYVSAAAASASGATDTIGSGEWASPVIQAQDGTNGSNGSPGTAGLNSATVFLYQRALSAPSVPGTTLTYTFATGILSGTLGSWTQGVPSGTNPVYIITATALGTGATDTIATGEWASPVVLAQNGTNGSNGTNGTDARNLSASSNPIFLDATYLSVVKSGQFTKAVRLTLTVGGTAISATSVTWGRTDGPNLTSVAVTSSGDLALSALTADSYVDIVATYGGIDTGPVRVYWKMNMDNAPPLTATSGRADITIGNNTGSYLSTPQSPVLTIPADGSGQIPVSSVVSYHEVNGAGSVKCAAKAGYRDAGGSTWSYLTEDVDPGVAKITHGSGGEPPSDEAGAISIDRTITGLTVGANYEIGIFIREYTVTGGADSGNFGGFIQAGT